MTARTGGTARRITIADVAERAGVSRAAVSKVFNGTGKISAATSERIRQAAKELNWSPSASAVALRRSRSLTIGLVLDDRGDGSSPSFPNSALIEGVESVLAPLGYSLLLHVADRSNPEHLQVYRMLSDTKRVDGVLLVNAVIDDPRFALLRDLALPAVLIGAAPQDDPITFVDSESAGAGVAESVELLVRLGHQRIAYVGGPEDGLAAIARRRAYEEACVRSGVTSLGAMPTDYSLGGAARATGRLLTASTRPTAILYGTDSMAIVGMRVAAQHGLRVPADLSVIGYDGISLGEWVEPPLTTVQRDSRGRGQAAAAALLQLLGEDLQRRPLGHPDLIVRGSTGPAPD